MNICDTAEQRSRAAALNGMDPKPWRDRSRNFEMETLEELADAWNYLTWAIAQRDIHGGRTWHLKVARALVATAYWIVCRAEPCTQRRAARRILSPGVTPGKR